MKGYVKSFLELLYPEKNTCFICNVYDSSIDDKYICSDCEKKLIKIVPPLCIKCSKPIDYASDCLCPDCNVYEKSFEAAKSPFSYAGIIKECIYNFKYYNKPYFYKFFGNLLLRYMNEINYTNFDFITNFA